MTVSKFAKAIGGWLNPGGLYLSASFSEKSKHFGDFGKYRKTSLGTVLYFSNESELESLLKSRFDIEDLKTIDIRGKHAVHAGVYALCRKKNGEPPGLA